ncbi:MAG: hypothetical protein AAF629_23695 [Chloroflexota bacterium]
MLKELSVRSNVKKLDEAVKQIKAGNKQRGKRLLSEILRQEPKNERAWLWMSNVVTDPGDRTRCLQQALKINPANPVARKFLHETQGASGSTEGIIKSREKRKTKSNTPSLLKGKETASQKKSRFNPFSSSQKAPRLAQPKNKPDRLTAFNQRWALLQEQYPFLYYMPHIRNWVEIFLATLFGINLLYASILGISNELRLRDEGLVATGFVVSLDERTSLSLWDYYATYNFETQDGYLRSETTEVSRAVWASLNPGQRVEILYLPQPRTRERGRNIDGGVNRLYFGSDTMSPLLSEIGQLVVALLLIVFAILLSIPYWYRRQLAKPNENTQGNVFEFGGVQMQVDKRSSS